MAKKTSKTKVAVEVAAGLVAAGAAAAAGYYFYGSNKAKSHRKIAAKWAVDMKAKVMKQAEKLQDIDARDFAKVVDTVATTYAGVRSVNATDLKRAAKELKANWEMVQKEMKKTGKKDVSKAKVVGKKAMKSAKKTVAKVAKKVTKK